MIIFVTGNAIKDRAVESYWTFRRRLYDLSIHQAFISVLMRSISNPKGSISVLKEGIYIPMEKRQGAREIIYLRCLKLQEQ